MQEYPSPDPPGYSRPHSLELRERANLSRKSSGNSQDDDVIPPLVSVRMLGCVVCMFLMYSLQLVDLCP